MGFDAFPLGLVSKKPREQGPRFSLSAEEASSILFAVAREIDQDVVIVP